MDLPPQPATNPLLKNYLDSVHWLVMLLHETPFRADLDDMLTSGSVKCTKLPFLNLTLIILAFGLKYTSQEAAQEILPSIELDSLQSKLAAKIEAHFLDMFDKVDLASVQASILLCTYYFYHGKPNRGYVVLGAALKSAKALGLCRESKWDQIDSFTRELRRQVWWALYAADGYAHKSTAETMRTSSRFAAICYGRPCSIHPADWEVGMICNLDDTLTTCPGFSSTEVLENGVEEYVTILS